MQIDGNGLEVLEREECMRLLATATLGRIGLTSGALPTVLPVNFRVLGDRIFIRTGRGTKLEAATDRAVVAFEVDDFDGIEHSGWSVVVTGVAAEITDRDEVARLGDIGVPRWAPTGEDRLVSITTELVSGRRLRGPIRDQSPIWT